MDNQNKPNSQNDQHYQQEFGQYCPTNYSQPQLNQSPQYFQHWNQGFNNPSLQCQHYPHEYHHPEHYFQQFNPYSYYHHHPPPPHHPMYHCWQNTAVMGQGRGWGRGRGRGRGHCKNGYNKTHEKKWKKEEKQKLDGKNSSQSSDSESEVEDVKEKGKRCTKIKNYKEFEEYLYPYFQNFQISPCHQTKVIKYLTKQYQSPKDLDPLLQTITTINSQSPQYFTSPKHLCFLRIVKEIRKQKFFVKHINARLDKILFNKAKKENKDKEFEKKTRHPKIQFLENEDLEEVDIEKTLFIVDGNNIMQKQKIFRQYFNSPQKEERVQGQIRLQWLFAETLKAELFFDYKQEDTLYQGVMESILSVEEEEKLANIPMHFADKHLDTNATADEKIVERLSQIVKNEEYAGFQIILVTADRLLCQECRDVVELKKTSGKYIFKYCKYLLRKLNYDHPEKKGIIKRIFTY